MHELNLIWNAAADLGAEGEALVGNGDVIEDAFRSIAVERPVALGR